MLPPNWQRAECRLEPASTLSERSRPWKAGAANPRLAILGMFALGMCRFDIQKHCQSLILPTIIGIPPSSLNRQIIDILIKLI